ncbi:MULTISPECIES: biopolymer transporter ExbD [unclassified Flavobacterium]|uniref:ExbD/TolR family protein n=1 Tax=unclassified Flavobacterium TaxID=196869 RepID=UPI000869C066|nr:MULTISPECIES: biopolymer transporter ExbD [unclassified Flavobacterium]MBN9284384.1 biopolymer transporter ExbD [Flavobacterium sp.]ODS81687.1 MAG: biopolymer transporter ExbD [Chryseobacterium sp. SCN 40-13]OJV72924.1 MAG: biopolymer transporter ExbD [Flavobacterium sp. 40-81]
MAKAKMSKKSTRIDMTAMCDVAFLLLSFFVMTSTAKLPEPLPVDTPASTVQTKLPDADLATITVGKEKVFFGVVGKDVRMLTLSKMGEKYNVKFTDEEAKKFSLIDGFGVPIGNLKQLIALNGEERNKEGLQPGIPYDSIDNQLREWILAARNATKEINNTELKIAIKGDAKEEYPTVKKVIDILQDQKVNKFFLVTGLRSEDF